MKFKDFVEHVNKMLVDNPKCADFDVVSASDDEGNYFSLVHYTPTAGYFKNEEFDSTSKKQNAVCVN